MKKNEGSEEREDFYRYFFDFANDALFVADPESGIILDANLAAEKLFDRPRDEIIGLHQTELYDPEEGEVARKGFAEAAQRGETSEDQIVQVVRCDGSHMPAHLTSSVFEVGERKFIQGILRDPTHPPRVEAALRESEERYRDLVEKAGVGILIDDEKGNIKFCNQRFADLFGYPLDEVKGVSLQSLIHSEDFDRVTKHRIDPIQSRPAPSQYEFRGIKSDGTTIHLEAHSAPLRDGDKIVGSKSYLLDLTQRRRAEAAFRSEKAYLERLFDSAPEAIVLTTSTGQVTSVNSTFTKLFGYTRDETMNRHIDELLAPPDRREEAESMNQMVLEGREVEIETCRMRKDGSTIDVSVIGAPIIQEGEAVAVYAIYRDVSEHKRLEREFQQAQKMEAVGLLAGGIAHDFNNILQSILGEAELLLQSRDDNPIWGQIEAIKTAAERAAGLTGQLLAFSRKQILRPQILNLNALVANFETMIGRLIGEDIQVRTNLAPDLASVKADPGQLEQVVLNLAVNSRDAMPEGGMFAMTTENTYVDFEAARELPGMQPGRYVTLVVSDSGIGMNEETKNRLFEPFYSTKDQGKGTGLGLATVYGIVGQSGGRVYVESEIGVGTEFTIYLPRQDDAGEPAMTPASTSDSAVGDETILLVEDDNTVREVVREMLDNLGYRILEAASPTEAMRIAQSHNHTIDLLLTDIVMPLMSGASLARQMCELKPGLRVLYMTGYTDETIGRYGVIESGFNLLQKPFSSKDLALKVRASIDQPADTP